MHIPAVEAIPIVCHNFSHEKKTAGKPRSVTHKLAVCSGFASQSYIFQHLFWGVKL